MLFRSPEESYLAQQMDIIDPDALHHARKFVRQELARLCKADLQDVWRENCIEGEYTLTPQAMGRRHLKNVCLSLLIAADSPDEKDITLAKQQYYEGDNMTDVLAALSAFVHSDLSLREELLDDFYKKWQADQLVMDKWLILQASTGDSSTLASVKKLMEHPAFSISNPNKIRSLIGAFGGNHFCFHMASGEGYTFLADQIRSEERRVVKEGRL